MSEKIARTEEDAVQIVVGSFILSFKTETLRASMNR